MKLITNIHQLLVTGEFKTPVSGQAMSQMPFISDAYLLIKDDRIQDYGTMKDVPTIEGAEIIDATGRIVLPMWCDSHTHLVYI